MKKLRLVVVATVIVAVLLVGCKEETKQSVLDNYFVTISNESNGDIIYDSRTGVQYWRSNGSYNKGNLTVLVDESGNPLIYEGDNK